MALPFLFVGNIKHGGICRHVINNLFQRINRHRRIGIAQALPSP
jgi:hypothetical protein